MAFNENKPVHNSDLSSSEIRENFKHLKQAVSKEHAWNDNDPNSAYHRFDQMRTTVGGSTHRNIAAGGYDYTTGVHDPTQTKWGTVGLIRDIHHTFQTLGTGNYHLQDILQVLITNSHVHQIERNYYNCNCNCNCNCGGNN